MAESARGWYYALGETEAQIAAIEALLDAHRAEDGCENDNASWGVTDGVATITLVNPLTGNESTHKIDENGTTWAVGES